MKIIDELKKFRDGCCSKEDSNCRAELEGIITKAEQSLSEDTECKHDWIPTRWVMVCKKCRLSSAIKTTRSGFDGVPWG